MPEPTAPNGGTPPASGVLTEEAVKQFLKGFGSVNDAVAHLLRDNRKYRRRFRGEKDVKIEGKDVYEQEIRELEDEVSRLRSRVIPDGHVAVPQAEATALEGYKKLGDLKTVTEAVQKKDVLEQTLAEREASEKHERIAKTAGFKPSVLTKLAKSENFVIEERDETVDGKTEKVPYARAAADERAPWLKLSEYAEKNLADFLPALRDESSQQEPEKKGVEFPRQSSSKGSAPSKDVVGSYVERTYATPSQLRKQQQS